MARWTGPPVVTAVVAVLLATCGCRGDDSDTTVAVDPKSITEANDDRVARAIKASYYSDEIVRGHAIDIVVENGVVTLRGTVRSERARGRATALARRVEGVTRVDDQLELNPSAAACDCIDEDRITRTIQAQYFLHPQIKHGTVHVSATSAGAVRLEGTVGSIEAKNEAVRIARELEGVTRVDNRLEVR